MSEARDLPGGPLALGIDIGGTFTDLVAWDPVSGYLRVAKVLTTPKDPAQGVLHGLDMMIKEHDIPSEALKRVVHATTLAANAVIERKGAHTVLLTTAGFGDLLEMRREYRYDIYDLFLEFPRPLVPRERVLEVRGRIDSMGRVTEPLQREDLERLPRLVCDLHAESVAICYLHSYANPDHEQKTEETLRKALPEVAISVSHRVAPEIGEYERASTVIVDAYVKPLLASYLRKLEEEIAQRCPRSVFFMMASHGGLVTVDQARERPVRLVESGPTAGVLAAGYFGTLSGFNRALAFDMGGTTAKGCLIVDGRLPMVTRFEVARIDRFKKGSGLPIQIPAVELLEIGAGGGSIAYVDQGGFLHVGPESAGASPGPACYGLGGTKPTVTDADLVLGFLAPDSFLGGRMHLSMEAARRALHEHIGRPLNVSPERAAWGVHELVNEQMAGAFRLYIAEMGQDPHLFTLIATGGAGPVHAYGLATKLGLPRIVYPPRAGVASAFGLLVAPDKAVSAQPYVGRLSRLDIDRITGIFRRMESECLATLQRAGVAASNIRIERLVDVRYVGQGDTLPVHVPTWPLRDGDLRILRERFDEAYAFLHGQSLHADSEIVTVRLEVQSADRMTPTPSRDGVGSAHPPNRPAPQASRRVWVAGVSDYQPVPVYSRPNLLPGAVMAGPAVLEEAESTIVVGADARIRVDGHLNIIAELERE